MNEEQLKTYTKLPPPGSSRLINFDLAEIVTLDSFPPRHVLKVTGVKPFLNMEVDLVPLVYIRQPEYWGIEVVGRLRGIGLPAMAPYTVSMPLDGFVGTQGIEVIGATRSQKIGVPIMAHTDACQWTATTTFGLDTVNLTVTGVCQEPTPGYKLTLSRVDVPGSDPDTLLLVLTVVPPTGIEPQHVTPTTVEYKHTFVVPQKHPSKVTIFEAAKTVQVTAAK
jgi:hypothetical protein